MRGVFTLLRVATSERTDHCASQRWIFVNNFFSPLLVAVRRCSKIADLISICRATFRLALGRFVQWILAVSAYNKCFRKSEQFKKSLSTMVLGATLWLTVATFTSNAFAQQAGGGAGAGVGGRSSPGIPDRP